MVYSSYNYLSLLQYKKEKQIQRILTLARVCLENPLPDCQCPQGNLPADEYVAKADFVFPASELELTNVVNKIFHQITWVSDTNFYASCWALNSNTVKPRE